MRLLLVEDEVRLAEALVHILKKNNYFVDAAFDGVSGQEMIENGDYDLIILDRMLPGKEGLEILKEIRKKEILTPVIILTAKDTISDRVEGLDSGADDYLIKPFSKEELLARIRALSRRKSDTIQNECIYLPDLTFDPLKGEITYQKKSIKFTTKEARLLELLLRNKNQVITKELIYDRIWGMDAEVDMNNIEVCLSYLRKKLNTINCNIKIETIRGVGYCAKEV